jgi:hypothetical protein
MTDSRHGGLGEGARDAPPMATHGHMPPAPTGPLSHLTLQKRKSHATHFTNGRRNADNPCHSPPPQSASITGGKRYMRRR